MKVLTVDLESGRLVRTDALGDTDTSLTAAPGKLPVGGEDGLLDASWLPESSGGGSSTGYERYDPDALPLSPTVYDDEFELTTLDGKWTWLNQGNAVLTVQNGVLQLSSLATGADNVHAIFQGLPTSTWRFTAKITFQGAWNSSPIVTGLFLMDSVSGRMEVFGPVRTSAGTGLNIYRYTATNVYSANVNPQDAPRFGYFEIESTSTNLIYRYSTDGLTWWTYQTLSRTSFLTNGPDRIGLAINPSNSGSSAVMDVGWFRSNWSPRPTTFDSAGEGSSGNMTNPMTTAGDLIVGSGTASYPSSPNISFDRTGVLLEITAAEAGAEVIIPGCDLTVTPLVGGKVKIDYTIWLSVNHYGFNKTTTVRLRRDDVNGSALDSTAKDPSVDTSSGHHFSWSNSIADTAPTTGHYVLTVHVPTAGGTIWTDTRVMSLYATVAAGVPARLPIGAERQVLTVVDGEPAWGGATADLATIMTQAGDMLVGGGQNGYPTVPTASYEMVDLIELLSAETTNEVIIPGLDLVVSVDVGESVKIEFTYWMSILHSGGNKTPTVRLRRDGLGGSILWTNTQSTSTDTNTGHLLLFTATVEDTAPTTGHYVLTTQKTVTGGQYWSDTRLMKLYRSYDAGAPIRLPVGSEGQVLTVIGGTPGYADNNPTQLRSHAVPTGGTLGQALRLAADGTFEWYTPSAGGGGGGGLENPMTEAGDLIYGLTSGVPARLGVGAEGALLSVTNGAPAWTTSAQLPLDVRPASPHAKNDEFDGTVLNAKWVDISTGANLQWSKTVAGGWLIAEPNQSGSSSTGKRLMGIRQDAPTGSFTISARLAGSYRADDTREGIFVAQGTRMNVLGYDLSNTNTVAAIGCNTYSETTDVGTYDGFVSSFGGVRLAVPLWVKVVWDASVTTLYFYYSLNGVIWTLLTSRASMVQPTRIGLCQYSQNSAILAADHQMGCDWFRVTEP